MEYSKEQLLAIETTGTNLLLSAAAGSGKTHTLVARILHLIEKGANVDEMLIITFTRAAAAEMRSRLIERLSKRAEAASGDGERQKRLYDQLRRAEYASIQTIDAHCADLLHAHFEAAGADPLFRVPDDAELKQIEARAFEDALEATYLASDDRLRALHFGRKVPQLARLVTKLFRFAENRPNPDDWLCWAVEELPALGGKIWLDELLNAARRLLREARALLARARDVCGAPDGPDKYLLTIQGDIEHIGPALNAGYDALCARLDALVFARMPPMGDKGLTQREIELRDQVKALRTDAKKGVDKAKKLLMPRELALEDIAQNQAAMDQLLALTRAFAQRREERMAERSLLSFADIQHKALRALTDPDVAATQRARFSHVFVDEYQDVSELQEAIIQKVARGDNLFMVGDVKQSIYRFRQAEPSLFITKYQRYGAGEGGMLIPLSRNYRSRASILEFTNAVFERAMTGGDREIEYDQAARLIPGAAFVGEDPPVELALISGEPASDQEPPESEPEEPEASEEAESDSADSEAEPSAAERNQAGREGAFIAARILELHGADHYDAKTKAVRPLSYRDFAVLLRSRTHMKSIESQLKRAGIPVYADAAAGYLDALEVKILLALLTVIENRRRDKELLIALRSPVVGLSSVDLATIRSKHLAGSYREAMLAYMDLNDDLAKTLRAFERRLDRWRTLSRALPLTILIDTVLRESRFYAIAGEMPAGEARQANLDLLITYAADFDSTQDGALTGFLRYVRKIEKSRDDMATAHTLGEGDDVVMLTTVHKSKGLEYPVVLAPMMDKALLKSERDVPLYLHRELGVALPLHDAKLGTRRKTVAQRAISERNRLETLNEEMRILYVLMTRAVDRLILVGSVKDPESRIRRWQASDPSITPKSFLDMLAPPMVSAQGGRIFDSRDAEFMLGGARARLRLVDASRLVLPLPAGGDASEDSAADEALLESFRRAIDWRYPYGDQVLLPLKLTATGVTRELTGPTAVTAITRRPRFLSGDGLSATERGSLIHAALMGLDLDSLRGLQGEALSKALGAQLARMLETGRLYAELDSALIFDFLSGELGQRLLAAKRVEREWAFNLNMSLKQAMGIDSDQRVLVQGVIDCCFLEDGRWVLLDYKTDRPGDIDALCVQYKPQLDLYAAALERITGIPVSSRVLCLLRARRNIEL